MNPSRDLCNRAFRIYSALNEAEIEIPFPQRDLHHKGLDRLAEAVENLARTGAKEKAAE